MANLGSLYYSLGIRDLTDADLRKIQQKLENLGIKINTQTLRQQIESAIGATPFNATLTFGNAKASLDALFTGKKYDVHVEAIASKLYESIKAALNGWKGAEAPIVPQKKELRKAVTEALLSAGFEINIGKVKGLSATISNVLGTSHSINVAVDPKKLASAINKAAQEYTGKNVSLGIKEKYLIDSIREALKAQTFPIRVVVQKAEAQEAVRQALIAAGLQQGMTAADKRASDARARMKEAEAKAAAANALAQQRADAARAAAQRQATEAHARMMEAQAKATASNALAQQRLAQAHNTARRATDSHIRSSISLGSAMRGNIRIAGELGPMLASAYSIVALKNFMQKVVEIGGQLEQQKLAMKAILGDEGMANTITSQINTLAVKSPFGVLELNQYAKQLTAFQIPYNELYETMKRMADISAAVGVDMGRIILAYGQVRAAKFLKGTELRQFTEANIPLIDMLSQRFSKLRGEIVSACDIMDMISKKQISFEDVQAVLWELTGEGGRFFNMQEELSESLKAKWKNLADAIDLMFADMADSTSEPLKGLAEILTELTSNWQQVAATLGAAGATYAASKVLIMAWNAALSESTLTAMAQAKANKRLDAMNLQVASTYRKLTPQEQSLIKTKSKLTGVQYEQLAASGALTKEETLRLIALKKIDDESINHIRRVIGISDAEVNAAKNAKAWKVRLEQLTVSLKNFGRAMLTAFINPATIAMAAFGALANLWQRNNEEMNTADEFGADALTKATEGAQNLRNVLKELPKSAASMNESELTSSIDKITQSLKDYAVNADAVIRDSLVNQQGEVATLTERYDTLRESLEETLQTYEKAAKLDLGAIFSNSIKEADSGWFDDSLLTDTQDYINHYNDAMDAVTRIAKESKNILADIIAEAKRLSPAFAAISASMRTDEQAFAELIRHAERYQEFYDAYTGVGTKLGAPVNAARLYFNEESSLSGAEKEIIKEWQQTLEATKAKLATEGILPENMSDEIRMGLIMQFRTAMSGLPAHIRPQLNDVIKESMKIDMEDGSVKSEILDNFATAILKEAPEFARRLKTGVISSAKDIELADYNTAKKMVTEAADKVLMAMPEEQERIQSYLNDHKFTSWVVLQYVAANQDSELKKMLWDAGSGNLLATEAERHFDRWERGSSSVAEVKNNAIKEGQEIQTALDEAQKNAHTTKEHIAKLQKDWDDAAEAYWRAGFGSLEDALKKKSNGGGRSNGDALLQDLKAKFKDLKDAWSMFKSWQTSVGDEKAYDIVANSGLFKYIPLDKIPRSTSEYQDAIRELQSILEDAGVKGKPERENLLNEMIKTTFDVKKLVEDETIRKALNEVSREAERQLADWNLYDRIRKATANENLAVSIAFGVNAKSTTDYPALIKKQFSDVAKTYSLDLSYDSFNEDELEAFPEGVKSAYEKATEALNKYTREQKEAIADILNEYQSLQDKLAVIDADRNRKLNTIARSDMSSADKATYSRRVNVEADYKRFTQSNEYLQFFSGIYALTEQEATKIGDLIRENLDKRLQAGTLSAEDYYKEIERINQQLDKIRNIKSDTMTYLTGGVKSLNAKKSDLNESARLEITQKIVQLEENLAAAKAIGNDALVAFAQSQLDTAREELSIQDKIRDKIIANEKQWQSILDIANIAASISGGLSDAFNSIQDMASALGVDTDKGMWNDVGAVLDTLDAVTGGIQKTVQSAMNGDIGGILSGAISTITAPFTIWSQLHDKKLQKLIERSQEAAQIMQHQYDILEKQMATFLGNAAIMNTGVIGGAYGKQRQLMASQLAELERQRQAEIDKKKTDDSVVADYDSQIEEMKIAIRDFAIEAANSIYGIDLNGWAVQLGDALVAAFAAGEDAAKAFDQTVGDIMRDVASKMISQDILAPMFGDLRNYLFGENGMGGAFGADFQLDASELSAMKTYLDKIKEVGIPAAEKLFDAINEATGGLLSDTETAKNGLSAGIQSVTEDTASLLASYVNSIRADVSVNRQNWETLINTTIPQINIVAQSQLDAQKLIAENTLRTAKAAEAHLEACKKIQETLRRATQSKGYGFYMQ